jgi:hypothetical protein
METGKRERTHLHPLHLGARAACLLSFGLYTSASYAHCTSFQFAFAGNKDGRPKETSQVTSRSLENVDKGGKRSVDCFQTNWESFALGLELEMKGVMGNKRRNEDEEDNTCTELWEWDRKFLNIEKE